jgi:sec-independent protein translocase protein TatC
MSEQKVSSFWDHLEVLRKVLFRCLIAWAIGATVAFCFKSILFNLLFAPSTDDFISYRGLAWLCAQTGWQALCPDSFQASFINTELAAQFMTHIKVALWAGLVLTSPYIIVQLYGFVAPALYDKEKRHAAPIIIWGTLLFILGVLMNYFIIFPFAFRFLNEYQVYEAVKNQISLSSYISNLLMLSLLMGVLFEIPIVNYLLAKIGLLRAELLKKYRRHAIVAITIAAAIITPTGDAVTLMLVTVPIYLLYEASILIVKRINTKTTQYAT